MSVTEPRIYTCAEWGARPPKSTFAVVEPRDLVVHHMAWPNRPLIPDAAAALAKAFEVARQCQADHMDGNGWSDTGQDFTVSRDGIILEGRHGALAAARAGKNVQSAHAADPDTGANDNMSYGTEHEGTYSTEAMPAAQWSASVHLHAWLSDRSGLDSSKCIGHRDTGCSTACPGDWLEGQLPHFRAAVHAFKLGTTSAPLPVKPPASPAPTVGNVHVMISHGAKTASAYAADGKHLWTLDTLTEGVNGGQDVEGGDTPYGTYFTTGQITPTLSTDSEAIHMEYGPLFIWLTPQADVVARAEVGIGWHGGGTALGPVGSQAPRQPLVATLGCLRAHNEDLVNVLAPLIKSEHEAGFHITITVGP